MRSILFVPLLLLCASSTVSAQEERLSADAMVQQAWRFLPEYSGEQRAFLTEQVRRETGAGAHLLAAAVALEPNHVRGLWSLGHAEILLAEDDKHRSHEEAAQGHYDAAVSALSRAIELQPSDPWALYARGAAHTSFGHDTLALHDLEASVEAADEQLRTSGDGGSTSWLRFKALEWSAEVLMRLGEHERARERLRSFHGEFSNNEWPLLIALAESHERERDFGGAREVLEEIVTKFESDHQAYALLGYLEGLVGDRAKATERLLQALEYELAPGMYTRMWLWILATDEARLAAEEDLTAFLANPPDAVSEWDLTLGRFVLGEGQADAFLDTARAEEARRMAAGEALDDLMCEAWFYAGLRQELDAQAEGDATDSDRVELRRAALRAYRTSLSYDPPKWKWEWAYARVHFAALDQELGSEQASPGFELEGKVLTVLSAGWNVDSAEWYVESTPWRVESARWHAPRAEHAVAALDRAPRTGDLLLAKVRGEDGGQLMRLVVGAP